MNLKSIDEKLERWKDLKSKAMVCLVDLDASSTYQNLSGPEFFRGSTALAAYRMKPCIARMWALSELIDAALTEILAERGQAPKRWEVRSWNASIERKLSDPLITLVGAASAPYLDGPNLTLAQAMVELMDDYDAVNGLVEKIDARLDELRRRSDPIRTAIKLQNDPALAIRFAALVEEIERDPLGVSVDSLGTVEASLARLEQGERSGLEAEKILEEGEQRIHRLIAAGKRAKSLANKCEIKFGRSSPVPTIDTADLSEWLGSLKRLDRHSSEQALRIGAAKWLSSCQTRFRRVNQAGNGNEAMLKQFEDLKGRFVAAQAKGRVIGAVLGPAAAQATRITEILSGNPIDLAELEQLVEVYERLVNA